ncbi:hypothetical protein JHW43_003861 [Diplocarpon mali]|nr:hypothetical protein JHW43_003861 [Diplocarpon mali]
MCTAQPVSGIFLQVTKQPFTSERNSAPLPPPSGFGKRDRVESLHEPFMCFISQRTSAVSNIPGDVRLSRQQLSFNVPQQGLWPWTPLPPNIKPQSDSFSRLTSPEIIPREDARQPKTQQHANLTWRHLTLEDFSTQKNELFWNFSPGYLHIPFVFSNARAAQSISQGAGQASLIWQSQRQMRPREMRRKIAGVLFENMVQLEGDNSALWDLMEFAPLFSSKMQAELDAGTQAAMTLSAGFSRHHGCDETTLWMAPSLAFQKLYRTILFRKPPQDLEQESLFTTTDQKHPRFMKKITRDMSEAQHRQHTRSQTAMLDLVSQESQERFSGRQSVDLPVSTARTLPFIDGPMAPALAVVGIAALHHAATGNPETESSLLALGLAMARVEMKLPYEPRTKATENTEGRPGEGPSCSKIPIVELLFEEAQRVDRDSLRLLLRYLGDLVEAFEEELDAKDREAADLAAVEAEVGYVLPRKVRGQ